MSQKVLPEGKTRVFDAVVDAIAMAAARDVQGVMDIMGLTRSPFLTVSPSPRRPQRKTFHETQQKTGTIQLFLSAAYGVDLRQLAADVRVRVRHAIYDIAGLDAQDINVVFTEIVRPEQPFQGGLPYDGSDHEDGHLALLRAGAARNGFDPRRRGYAG